MDLVEVFPVVVVVEEEVVEKGVVVESDSIVVVVDVVVLGTQVGREMLQLQRRARVCISQGR